MVILPVFDMLLLPDVVFHFKKDMLDRLTKDSFDQDEDVLFLLQKADKHKSDLTPEDFYPIGLVGKVESIDSEGDVRIRVLNRVEFSDLEGSAGVYNATASVLPEEKDLTEQEEKAIYRKVKHELLQFVQGFQWGVWARGFISHWNNLNEIVCALSNYLDITPDEKYDLICINSRKERSDVICEKIYEFMELTKVGQGAEDAQKEEHERLYREQALKKQIEILQSELDEMHPENSSDGKKFEQKLAESGMQGEALAEAQKVLNRMKQEGKNGHEYGMLYDYLEFVTSLSWKKAEPVDIDLQEAEDILNEDHYGLEKVKERIIQQIAVMALNKKQSGSILLFVGAPGTGKTSIGQSIAHALHREYTRISLGGVRDEAEIRGHRRTYVGAMPGRIMEGMKRCGTSNPVIVLDEVDKLAREFHGDPASALLEVLDPEQNHTFTDHYVNAPYDLSDVFFVCTANSIDTIPEPLLNRMEVIQFPGYTAIEKYYIATRHLLPNAMASMGIRKSTLKVTEAAMRRIISEYTAESGVRSLKKQMDVLCRKAAVQIMKGECKSLTVGVKKVPEMLGTKHINHDVHLEEARPGIVTGLAWTRAGGEILFIETAATDGDQKMIVTGQLGDVMKESVQIARTLIREHFPEEAKALQKKDIHVHVPAGATPKDGPSAGITISTALLSLVLNRTVDTTVAMTGEISLRGAVMPIGGLPEKLMAAQRAGIKKVFIPYANIVDLEEIPAEVKDDLEIIPVKWAEEVWKAVGLID